MGWLKRNLFFAIGILAALGLLGAALYYDYKSWEQNNAALSNLNEIYTQLQNNTVPDGHGHNVSPGNSQVDNVKAAIEQAGQLTDWIRQARAYYQPIESVPNPTNGPISNEAFAGALHQTLDTLQREAEVANVQLPPQFLFSFTAQSDKVVFAPGSVELLARQLGEVQAILETLYAGRVNALESIQRVPVSDDDTAGPPSDYLGDRAVTSDMAVLTPYQLTFRGFSPEVAQALEAFAASPHGFIIKTMSVLPANMNNTPNGAPNGDQGNGAPAPMPPSNGAFVTALTEHELRITMEIEVVKLSPGI
jgi:hypothetical protein